MSEVRERFCPDVVVCQCGADGLANDPMDSYNLTPAALGECVQCLLAWQKPVLLLGGGMFIQLNFANVRVLSFSSNFFFGNNMYD